ncbi:MAG: uroporphyrinogen-III synthase [Flavobacteriales bacterium]|jgi:uroporphyrinogen-III synthase
MRVFFSAESTANIPLMQATQELSIELIAHPLIAFNALQNTPRKPYEVIFFSSPRSYTYGKALIRPEVLVACYSHGTAKHLSRVDWQGNTPGNPARTAQEFNAWVGQKSVLFPVSDRSLGSVSKVFPEAQKEVVTVYETLLLPTKVPLCSIYIFTSPSNAEAFLQVNDFPKDARAIAWGDSTRSFLESKGIIPAYTRKEEQNPDWTTLLTP